MKNLIIILLSIFTYQTVLANPLDLSGPVLHNDQVVFEANDAGETVGMSLEAYQELTGQSFLMSLVSFFDFKKSFENVSYEKYGESDAYIPSQHMRVLRKTSADQKVFVRDADGVVTDIYEGVMGSESEGAFEELQGLMPVSSGASHKAADPQPYVDTPTGIYRINHAKSRAKRYSTGMWHSLYFDLVYPWGKDSGLAIHGTSKSAYKNLGTQQSHGCVRITQPQANMLYETLLSKA